MNKLVQDWMPQNESLKEFYKDINHFLERNLKHSITEDIEELVKSKTIADPLIGYIHFEPIEMYIIDTPLFQRLRGIKQLGLANLVFPSVGYSRFEHSLGVLGRVNQLLNKITENNQKKNTKVEISKIIDENKTSIRLSALLHDLGHCLFSHCSERVINDLEQSKNIQSYFTEHFKKQSNIPFAEIFTLSIIGSKTFSKYLKSSELQPLSLPKLENITLKNTAYFILGLPNLENSETIFLGQLISSGLDADKIDYMTREQHYSGIKLQIDLERILSKLQVFEIDYYELPKNLNYLKQYFSHDKKFKVLGFGKGGQFVFEEFCIARLALHVKIYLHPKIRLSESQLSQCLNDLSKLDFLKNPVNWLYLTEDIIKYPKNVLDAIDYNKEDLFNSVTAEMETNLLKIHNRELYFRTFAFGILNSKNTKYEVEENNYNYFKKFEDKIDLNLNYEFKEQIIAEVKKINNILKITNIETEIDSFIIEVPRLLNIQQGQESLYFDKTSSSGIKWTIPIDKIMNYFQENRALGYIFADLKIAPILCIASEKVFFEQYKDVFEQDNFISKNVYKEYIKYKEKLTEQGYYDKYPQLKIISGYLHTAEANEKINSIFNNLRSFKSLNDETITINRITTFVNQFPINLQNAVLEFLTHLNIYSEKLLVDEVEKILSKQMDNKCGLSYLGGNTDSGSKFGYHMREILKQGNHEIEHLNDNLISSYDSLIIYDDNINSGLQLINILAELLDEKDKLDPEQRLDEEHLKPLQNTQNKVKIKDMNIYFIYTVGYEGIETKIKNILSEKLGFDKNKIHIIIHKIFNNDDKILSGANSKFQHAKRKELKDYLTSIGVQLLTNEGKKDTKIESCSLGYAKAEAMVLFPYNVPTMTITALWCRGKINNNIPWIPLAERRRRTKNGKFVGED
jgi:hypothetical protein